MGCAVIPDSGGIRIKSSGNISRLGTVRTAEYPGFPTDAQPVLLAASCVANGTSIFVENIFSNRFRYVSELIKMGARISVLERVAVVDGVPMLTFNGDVMTGDFYRTMFPEDVKRGYHCPPVQQPYFNTVNLDGNVPDGEILRMIDGSYRYVVSKLAKKVQKELE